MKGAKPPASSLVVQMLNNECSFAKYNVHIPNVVPNEPFVVPVHPYVLEVDERVEVLEQAVPQRRLGDEVNHALVVPVPVCVCVCVRVCVRVCVWCVS